MALSANKIKTVRQTRFYGILELGGLSIEQDATPLFESNLSTGADAEYLNSSGILSINMVAGETVSGFFNIPTDWDRENPIYARVVWTNAAAAGGDVTFILLYKAVIPDTDTLALPATALNTVLVADTKLAAHVIQTTANGKIKAGVIGNTARFLAINLEADAFTTITSANVLGIEFEYTPKMYKGRIVEAPAWSNVQD